MAAAPAVDAVFAAPAGAAGPVRCLVHEPAELLRLGIQTALAELDVPPRLVVLGPGAVAAWAPAPRGDGTTYVVLVDAQHLDGLAASAVLCAILRGGPGVVLASTASAQELRTAVEAAVAGRSWVSPELTGVLLAELAAHRQPAGSQVHLTAREHEVLVCLVQGMGNREIARKLVISENTVKNHVRNLLDKLHAHTRTEVVVHAVREHLIELS